MRAHLPSYELSAPRDLAEALGMLAETASRPFSGGTDLMVQLESGNLPRGRYISLWALDELRGIDVRPEGITLGALTTYSDVLQHPVLQAEFPLLCRAAAQTGGVATQNRGTIGGNIANASPAADTPPALLVYDAELTLRSVRGSRRVPYERFHHGYKVMDLAADEIITSVTMARGRSGWIEMYRKVGARRAQAISKVCLAAAAVLDGERVRDVRIALSSVAPTVVRCTQTERAIRGQALGGRLAEAARLALPRDIAPIDDVRSTAKYRLRVAQNLVGEFLAGLGR